MAEISTVNDRFLELDQKHPDYIEWESEWRLFSDVLGDTKANKEDYLPKAIFENKELYDFRLKLSEFIPDSPLSVNKIIGALYQRKPARDFKTHAGDLNPMLEDVDLDGTAWDDFIAETARILIGYGTTRILINFNDANLPGGTRTLAMEQEAGARPFLINYTPLSVIDWDVSRFGQLRMVRIKEERVSKGGSDHVDITLFITYTEDEISWVEFAKSRDDGTLSITEDRTVQNTLGMVPMIVTYFPRKVKSMIGSGYIRFSSKADIRKIRSESDLHYDTYVHSHPTLWVKTKEDMSDLGIGTNTYVKLNPDENEEMGYAEVPTSAFEALMKVIELNVNATARHTGTDPMGQLQAVGSSVFQASGVARAWSFGTSEARILSSIADRMEKVETKVLDIMLRFKLGESPKDRKVFTGDILYPEDYDTSAIDSLGEQTQNVGQSINSPTLQKVLQKRWASGLAGDVSQDVHDQIMKEIEDNPLINTTIERRSPFDTLLDEGLDVDGVVDDDDLVDGIGKKGVKSKVGRGQDIEDGSSKRPRKPQRPPRQRRRA